MKYWWYAFRRKVIWIIETPRRIKYFIQRGRRGYSDEDVWNLNNYLADVISGGCRGLIQEGHVHPIGTVDAKEWHEILEEIAVTFDLFNDEDEIWWGDYQIHGSDEANKAQVERSKRVEKGKQLFIKWFPAMWD